MRWTWNVLRHRALAQRALFLPVLAVTVVSATLLGTFALLLSAGQHRALEIGLERQPVAQREIDARYMLEDDTAGPSVLSTGNAALDDFLGSLPVDRTAWLSSQMYEVDGTAEARAPYVYVASYPVVADGTRLVDGSLPTSATDAAGHLQVAIPQEAAQAYGWHVGSVVRASDAAGSGPATFVVTGTFERTGALAPWSRDVLAGATHDPSHPVVGSSHTARTQAWGPFLVTPDAFTSGRATLVQADLVAAPRFGDTAAAEVTSLRDRLGTARATLSAATPDGVASFLLTTQLPQTIDAAETALGITQVGLVIVGLVLVVLTVTVLLLAARLLAERRAAEQSLMASRGATNGQILRLAALESLAVAVVTTAIAPWLSSLLYRVVTGVGPFERAGLHTDPGLPRALWVTCAATALVLAGVLLGPVLTRRADVVDADPQVVRRNRGGGLARTGADLALVVLAAIALVQLRTYRTPAPGGVDGIGSLDPVLVVTPALVLLAGGVLALRLLPHVARLWERAAARSRALVGPLAAWEVARRPGRAAGAMLLLTLVVGGGTFAQSFLATWHGSQLDQSDLAVGTDVRVVSAARTPLAASATVSSAPHVRRAAAVTDRSVTVGSPWATSSFVQEQLVAVDTTHADDLLRGRTDAAGWSRSTAALHPTTALQGVPLPGAPTDLVLDLTSSSTPALAGGLFVSLVVQDAHGGLTSVDLRTQEIDGTASDVVVPLGSAAAGSTLVGVKVAVMPTAADEITLARTADGLGLDLTVSNLRVVPSGGDATDAAPVPLDSVDWTARGLTGPITGPDAGSSVTHVAHDGDALRLSESVDAVRARSSGMGLFAVTTPAATSSGPVLVTPGLLSSVGSKVGDQLTVDLGDATVDVTVAGTVDHLPGEPGTDGILADSTTLARAYLLAGGTASLTDEWWLQVPDADADAVAADLVDVGAATTRVAAREDATVGPLHVGVVAALWIVTVAGVGLAVAGLALSATFSVRTRRLELARLQAVGASRRGLVRSVLTEYAVLGSLGVVAGLALGALLGRVIVPLVTVSASGGPPVPSVLLHAAWTTQLRLLVVLVVLVGVTVATTTNALLRRASGELLRLGDDR
ncbi:FtsX-like permease family protein [Luteimicrobium subarcticum]|uniref:FtsX-like permease family protein n=1 Tax=Luteimicrobium subarcticum TaxID=620910 RepID=A0A2M8WUX7_9MICO|nr:FtsX-like permease family protein [Luteimicrobium subarcticum]PJI94676.1 FtsX-like permease family protein [Luteimicrobium subarcticum]